MKYIAIFDIPDGYKIGCATAKIAPGGKEVYADTDYENAYAHVEPLAEPQTELFERFETVDRIIHELGLGCAFDMPGFWTNNRKDYKVIPTKWHQGYMKALQDVEKEARLQFGFSEKVNVIPVTEWPERW